MLVPDAAAAYIAAQRTGAAGPAAYVEHVRRDAEQIAPHLKGCETILSIGCGAGGAEVELHRLTGAHMHLMDGTGWSKKQSGYGPVTGPWNALAVTAEMMRENQIPFTLHEIDPTATIPVDAVISLLSWGYHYPADTYEGLARRSTRKVILDLRKGAPFKCFEGWDRERIGDVLHGRGDRMCLTLSA